MTKKKEKTLDSGEMAKITIKYFTLANVDILTLTTKTELFMFCRYDISLWLIYDCQLFASSY